ncbi:serine-arginine protein 55-like [Cylas formicarius]|uniref:serine-arginine protein 55-like n=1 Tax=Cylas formicarius TaxID=197179 RepID=UPI0029587E62|nr:serine-arginine protein 55-like [Cylas formicarius]
MSRTKLFLGGIAPNTREKDVEWFFRKYGKLRKINLKNGFAFVEFGDKKDADDAIYEMNGKELLGERISVERARGGRSRSTDPYRRSSLSRYAKRGVGKRSRYAPLQRTHYRLVVGNLSSKVNWQGLKDYMRQAGEVTFADAHKQRRNEGIVEFASHKGMDTAISRLNHSELEGRKIRLSRDRGGRRASSSSSSSKSRSRSRKRSSSNSRNSSVAEEKIGSEKSRLPS